jgi:hypothetical protein
VLGARSAWKGAAPAILPEQDEIAPRQGLADNRATRYSAVMSDLGCSTISTGAATMISIMGTITKRLPAGPEVRG